VKRLRGSLPLVVLLALLASTWAAHRRLLESRRQGREAHAALAGVLTRAEMASVTLLGGFRSIAVDILWIHLLEALDEQRFEEMPALWSALEGLQGSSPTLHLLEAREMVLDIPRYLAHRPEDRWNWIRRGLESLSKGLQRYPASLALLREAEYLYYQRFDPRISPGDRERFLAERPRPGDTVDYGRDPLQIARAAGERALEDPRHSIDIDILLWAIHKLSYGVAVEEAKQSGRPPGSPGARDSLQGAARLLEHVEKAHRDHAVTKELLPKWREQLEEGLRAEGMSRP
jgi:hypothetical protein